MTDSQHSPSQEDHSGIKTGPFAVLRESTFLWFLCGTMLTNAAQWIQNVSLSWLVYDATSSGAMLGSINLVRSIATVGLAPVAGWAIDRYSRRTLLYANSIWLLLISAIFGLVLLLNPTVIWPLFIFSFLGGMAQALSMPLRQTVVFSVVPRHFIPGAVAIVQTGWAVMRSVGPAFGGFLLLLVGPSGNFFVQAGAYALVALTLIKLRMPYEQKSTEKTKSSGNFREGWNYLVTNRHARIFLLMSLLLPLLIVPNFNALTAIYAKDIFEGGPETLGLLLSSIGIGGIAGGIVITLLKKLERRGLLQLAALLLLSLALIAYAFSSKLWMGMVCLGVAGFSEMIFITTNSTLLQLSIPGSIRGRVMGIVSLKSGLTPVGAFLAGLGADLIGPRAITLCFAAGISIITILIFFASPSVRDYRLSKALNSPSEH